MKVKTYEDFCARLCELKVYGKLRQAALQNHGASLQDIFNKNNRKHVSAARGEVMSMIRDQFGWSNPAIGELFGGRDATSVLHAIRVYENKNKEKAAESEKPNEPEKVDLPEGHTLQ